MINKVGEVVGFSSGINIFINFSFKIIGIVCFYKVGVGWIIDVLVIYGKVLIK